MNLDSKIKEKSVRLNALFIVTIPLTLLYPLLIYIIGIQTNYSRTILIILSICAYFSGITYEKHLWVLTAKIIRILIVFAKHLKEVFKMTQANSKKQRDWIATILATISTIVAVGALIRTFESNPNVIVENAVRVYHDVSEESDGTLKNSFSLTLSFLNSGDKPDVIRDINFLLIQEADTLEFEWDHLGIMGVHDLVKNETVPKFPLHIMGHTSLITKCTFFNKSNRNLFGPEIRSAEIRVDCKSTVNVQHKFDVKSGEGYFDLKLKTS